MELYEQLERKASPLTELFIFASGASSNPIVAEFLARVRRPFLEKPFDLPSLHETVVQVAAKAR